MTAEGLAMIIHQRVSDAGRRIASKSISSFDEKQPMPYSMQSVTLLIRIALVPLTRAIMLPVDLEPHGEQIAVYRRSRCLEVPRQIYAGLP